MAALTLEIHLHEGGTRREEFSVETIVIGRDKEADLMLPGSQVGRRHASIRPTNEGYILEDMESKNGTFVNGTAIQSKLLRVGDEIRIGQHVLRVVQADPHWSQTLRNLVLRPRVHTGAAQRLGRESWSLRWFLDPWTLTRLGVGILLCIALSEVALALGWIGSSVWGVVAPAAPSGAVPASPAPAMRSAAKSP